MNNLCVFLNTRVENSGALAWIGDKGLAPFRYLFNGKTICIQPRNSDQKIEIHHVASFHKLGSWNSSNTSWNLKSSSTGMIKTALSVVLLVPGLLFAAFKGFAYLFSDVREKHHLAKEHFTPVNREIGSTSNPIRTRKELSKALEAERKSNPKNPLTNVLIIHGDGALTINEDPGILQFNPMKLVLEGAKINRRSPTGRLDDAMGRSHKWLMNAFRIATASKPRRYSLDVNSIDEAIQATCP